ncbi:MAG: universal stress protein [Planctomycetota bacterium]
MQLTTIAGRRRLTSALIVLTDTHDADPLLELLEPALGPEARVDLLTVGGKRPPSASEVELLAEPLRLAGHRVTTLRVAGAWAPAVEARLAESPPLLTVVPCPTSARPFSAVWRQLERHVLARAPATLVVKPDAPRRLRRILLPLDGSEQGDRVTPFAAALARGHGAEALLLRAQPTGSNLAALRAHPDLLLPSRRALSASVARSRGALDAAGVPSRTLTSRHEVTPAIVRHARRHAVDLVALSTHGDGGLVERLLGTRARAVLRHTPASALVLNTARMR